jgi:hypothetical protein
MSRCSLQRPLVPWSRPRFESRSAGVRKRAGGGSVWGEGGGGGGGGEGDDGSGCNLHQSIRPLHRRWSPVVPRLVVASRWCPWGGCKDVEQLNERPVTSSPATFGWRLWGRRKNVEAVMYRDIDRWCHPERAFEKFVVSRSIRLRGMGGEKEGGGGAGGGGRVRGGKTRRTRIHSRTGVPVVVPSSLVPSEISKCGRGSSEWKSEGQRRGGGRRRGGRARQRASCTH